MQRPSALLRVDNYAIEYDDECCAYSGASCIDERTVIA